MGWQVTDAAVQPRLSWWSSSPMKWMFWRLPSVRLRTLWTKLLLLRHLILIEGYEWWIVNIVYISRIYMCSVSITVSIQCVFSTPSPWCGSDWSGLRGSGSWPGPRCSTWWLMTCSRQTGHCTSGKQRLTRQWPGSRGSEPSCPAGGGHTWSRRRPSLYRAMWMR